ncbi:heterokaryon incompatibility protein-domain-containing protein [Stachybotrys elegans]|uniref:Heterokaryon incompatibility protein-domain-containing protein n=1 Tax=Stachybotrys elegans TaxID=80388 RepID=A0A8K0WNP1_9HYPO|nr:heterokaryon incompatibility protein-domain-containing protein [Stachybotrys elegans]
MRLIKTDTLELEEFSGQPPPYAILSHTWGEEEVSLQQFQDPASRTTRAGFEKITMTCKQAQKDGLDYAWVDTCCIDKSSSAELSEAINSMFTWYRESERCYAYLPDVPEDDDPWSAESTLPKSSWFTRGWTLQELIAPRNIVFYGEGWHRIGDKKDLQDQLERITKIDKHILQGGPLSKVSVAKRMSWAAHRKTRRKEDIAYCLMGIFNVNMPMLYGEGSKAFIRLQEEILKDSEDQTLFAWRATPDSAKAVPFRGILASSPDEFANCGDIVPFRHINSSRGAQKTIYVSKSAHETEPPRAPQLERQHAFYISHLPEDVQVGGVYPPTVTYSSKLHLLELGHWIQDKAAVELKVSWTTNRILILLWAAPIAGTPLYKFFYAVALTPPQDVKAIIEQFKRPKDVVHELIRPGKVQSFDMFCIELLYSDFVYYTMEAQNDMWEYTERPT